MKAQMAKKEGPSMECRIVNVPSWNGGADYFICSMVAFYDDTPAGIVGKGDGEQLVAGLTLKDVHDQLSNAMVLPVIHEDELRMPNLDPNV